VGAVIVVVAGGGGRVGGIWHVTVFAEQVNFRGMSTGM
jgi:hypothetical protein